MVFGDLMPALKLHSVNEGIQCINCCNGNEAIGNCCDLAKIILGLLRLSPELFAFIGNLCSAPAIEKRNSIDATDIIGHQD